jgi:hypothetical protein
MSQPSFEQVVGGPARSPHFVTDQLPTGIIGRIQTPDGFYVECTDKGEVRFSDGFTDDKVARAIISDLLIRDLHLTAVHNNVIKLFGSDAYRLLCGSVKAYHQLFVPPAPPAKENRPQDACENDTMSC